MLYFHHAASLAHDPSVQCLDHPDTPERISAIETAMAEVGWLGCDLREAPAATQRELELVHTTAHVRRIRDLCIAGGGQIDADTYVGEESYRAALHAAGGACEMVRALMRGEARAGFSAMRPSGHHAGPDYAMGFCLFNNVAVAAELAIHELGLERVLIIDWDVHHGNGTADIFSRRPDVLYASIHELGLFPGTGEVSDAGSAEGRGYTINVPVPHGSDDQTWVSALEYVVIPAALEFAPQLVLISAGFDAHRDDPLAGLEVTTDGYRELARLINGWALAHCAGRSVWTLEGGYDLRALSESALRCLEVLAEGATPGGGQVDSAADRGYNSGSPD
jgi:acetoin utilization deacetylase AcuC-like enzyme